MNLLQLDVALIHAIYPSNINLHPFTLRLDTVKHTKLGIVKTFPTEIKVDVMIPTNT